MRPLSSFRFILTAVAFVILLAACGSGDSTAEVAAPEPAAEEAETGQVAEDPAPEAETEEPAAEEPADAETDDVTPEPVVEPAAIPGGANATPEEAAADALDLIILQLGIPSENLIATAECVTDQLEAEGIEFTGDGAPEFVALIGCEPDVIETFVALPASAAPPADRACILNSFASFLGELPLQDADRVLGSPAPPEDLVASLSEDCGLTEDTVLGVLGG